MPFRRAQAPNMQVNNICVNVPIANAQCDGASRLASFWEGRPTKHAQMDSGRDVKTTRRKLLVSRMANASLEGEVSKLVPRVLRAAAPPWRSSTLLAQMRSMSRVPWPGVDSATRLFAVFAPK